jgi:hypothetical protein
MISVAPLNVIFLLQLERVVGVVGIRARAENEGYQKPRPENSLRAGLSIDAWAMRGSNPRPRACEARALTS